MIQYVIYLNPSDYPDCYVVRRWRITSGSDPVAERTPYAVGIGDDALAMMRADLTYLGLTCIGRETNDDSAILEVWI